MVNIKDIVRGEHDENAIRKNFLPSEMVAIAKALEPRVATPEGRPSTKTSESFASLEKGRTIDKVASFVGVSGRTLEKAARVVEAAEQEKTLAQPSFRRRTAV